MFDLETLLAPLPGTSPCGADLLFSPQFDAIQRAREHDDPALEQGEWVTDLKEADWTFVITESTRLLSESTKDLRLAAWLTDALGVKRGFAGLADGYRLLAGLCERYWEEVHPRPEQQGDFEARTGNVAWLLQRTIDLLKRTPIVSDLQTRYDMLTLETALALNHQIKRDPAQADELRHGKISLEQFEQVARATPRQFMLDLHTELLDCEAAISGFERVFDQKVGSDGPSFSPLKQALADLRSATERFAREAGVNWDTAEASSDTGANAPERDVPGQHDNADTDTALSSAAARDSMHRRAQAIAQLKQIAAYFESAEPSSPVAYLLKKAARWADMPLHAWLRNVIKNEQERTQLEELLDVLEKGSSGSAT